MQYNPVYKPNQLICGEGRIAIVSGWTQAKFVAQQLDRRDYAAIGQLYSPTRGISFLFRNLLANPHVHAVVAINATSADVNAGSVKALVDFFNNGFERGETDTGRECWVIKSKITGYIDIEIEESALKLLRKSISCGEVFSVAEAVKHVKLLVGSIASAEDFSGGTAMKPWAESMTFPTPEIESIVFPGQRYGHRIEGATIAETWVKLLHRIRTTGTLRPTGYDGQWQELIDLMAIVTDEPPDFYFPEPNFLPLDRPFLDSYIPQILDDDEYREGVKYTYGQRMRSWFGNDQIEEVVTKLVKEIDAASAVISLWDAGGNKKRRLDGSSDHQHGGSPCLNHVWFRVVDGELSMTATFRSNDMFAAWPSNAMGLRALQQYVRDAISLASNCKYDLGMGPLITISQSAHIYDDTFENVDTLIQQQYAKIAKVQNFSDPVGNFLVEVEGDRIQVSRTTPGSGEIVGCYSGKQPIALVRQICADAPAIDPAHIGYLGIELEKAKHCLNTGTPYTQDQ